MKKSYLQLTIVFSIVFFSVNLYSQKDEDQKEQLVKLMTGSFNSEIQSKIDTTYYNISLHMYPIWQKDTTTNWFYVEQALNSKQDKPYRQRIYKLDQLENNTFKTTIFAMQNEKSFIGKWKDGSFFDQYDSSILKERIGCEVYLNKTQKGSYEGSTKDKHCNSSLKGASYATSKVKIGEKYIYSWDQGFDKNDLQVWGAKKAGYRFDKL